ncbi:TPA: AAA family ATPase [Legionella pneumophila]
MQIGSELQASKIHRYNAQAFFLPAWEEIYSNDSERTISFYETKAFETDLREVYNELRYTLIEVPLGNIPTRVDFILDRIK